MLPLLFPELENELYGFIALNSAPCLWLKAAAEVAMERNLPDLTPAMLEFTNNPNADSFKKALSACMPYYFPPTGIVKGWNLLKDLPFQYLPAVWWQRKVVEINFNAKWAPQQIPMLIIGGEYDSIVPISLYRNDKRFQQKNIIISEVKDAGHLPWIENPQYVDELFQKFINSKN